MVLIGPLMRAARDERVVARLADAQLTAAQHAVDAPIPVAKLAAERAATTAPRGPRTGAARRLGAAAGVAGRRGGNEQTEHSGRNGHRTGVTPTC